MAAAVSIILAGPILLAWSGAWSGGDEGLQTRLPGTPPQVYQGAPVVCYAPKVTALPVGTPYLKSPPGPPTCPTRGRPYHHTRGTAEKAAWEVIQCLEPYFAPGKREEESGTLPTLPTCPTHPSLPRPAGRDLAWPAWAQPFNCELVQFWW